MKELKPCPFCGNIPKVETKKMNWRLFCEGDKNCGFTIYFSGWAGEDELAEAWNTRYQPDKE